MAAASTLIGFGVLLFADHSLLKSAGFTSFLGIFFSVVGAFVLLPPLLERIFADPAPPKPSARWQDRVHRRYRNLEGFPRIFARFKLRLDPMFPELPDRLEAGPLRTALDIGCGYGVPACALAEWYPGVRVYGLDPDPERVRVADAALGQSGTAADGGAPDIDQPGFPDRFDAVLLLDVIHYLPDAALHLTLKRVYDKLKGDGRLVIRAVIPPSKEGSWLWRLDTVKRRLTGAAAWYRPAGRIREMALTAGFRIEDPVVSGGNPESVWFVARPGETVNDTIDRGETNDTRRKENKTE
jgi:SAM-dependent methyltransferase